MESINKTMQVMMKKMMAKFLPVFLVLTAIHIADATFAQNNCNTTLTAEKNRTVKTFRDSEYTYTLYLENADDVVHEYEITASNYNEGCENPDGSPSDNNISIDFSIIDTETNLISEKISIQPGGELKFYVKLIVPDGASFETWNCSLIQAVANSCDTARVILHTYSPNPLNHE